MNTKAFANRFLQEYEFCSDDFNDFLRCLEQSDDYAEYLDTYRDDPCEALKLAQSAFTFCGEEACGVSCEEVYAALFFVDEVNDFLEYEGCDFEICDDIDDNNSEYFLYGGIAIGVVLVLACLIVLWCKCKPSRPTAKDSSEVKVAK